MNNRSVSSFDSFFITYIQLKTNKQTTNECATPTICLLSASKYLLCIIDCFSVSFSFIKFFHITLFHITMNVAKQLYYFSQLRLDGTSHTRDIYGTVYYSITSFKRNILVCLRDGIERQAFLFSGKRECQTALQYRNAYSCINKQQ